MSSKEFNSAEEIHVSRSEANFDRACDEANIAAHMRFGIDELGHSSRIEGWQRSSCWIDVEFFRYKRTGVSHWYTFLATARRSEEES